jgi:hypothetical protein
MITQPDLGQDNRPSQQRPSTPYGWFAVIGGLSFAIGISAWTAWIASGDATPTPTGEDPVPTLVVVGAWVWQVISVVVFLWWVTYLTIRSRRERRITFDAVFVIGGTLIAWQEPFMTYLRPATLLYDSYWINLGSWGPHLPGFLSDNNKHEPLPLLYELCYGAYYLTLAVFGCAVMKFCARRWPQLSNTKLILCCYTAFLITEPLLDLLYVRISFYQYGHGTPWLTLWAGKPYQIPIPEILDSCLWFTALAAVRYFRDSHDHSIAERGINESARSTLQSATLRILAVAGYLTIANTLYMAMFNWAGIYGDPVPRDMPSYMINKVCGPGTDHPCSIPNIPTPQPDLPPH